MSEWEECAAEAERCGLLNPEEARILANRNPHNHQINPQYRKVESPVKHAFIGQAFMLPSYMFILLAIIAAPDMELFLTFMAWAGVAMLAAPVAAIWWIRRAVA